MKNVEDFYPLSPMQQGMLFHSLYAPDSGVYIGQLACALHGDLDITAFERAWQGLLDRHPILRTAFVSGDLKEPVQVVHRRVSVPLEQHDWRGLGAEEQAAHLDALLLEDQRRGFKLAAPPLLRLTLARTADDVYQFLWTYHHLLFDGWSLPLLLQEVFARYEAFRQGRDLPLPPARPFRSYIGWLKKQDMAAAEAFWRRTLAGFSAPTPLVVDRAPERAEGQAPPYAEPGTLLAPAATQALDGLARRHGLTINTLVQGAWAVLLSRYSGAEDIVFGATVSGRPAALPGAETMVGLFINTLPVRVRVAPGARALDWLAALQAHQAELRQYEYSPLVQIQGWSEVPRGVPLFESILVFENTPAAEAVSARAGSLAITGIRAVQQTNFPLTVVAEPGEQLMLLISYDPDRFDAATIERMLGHLRTLLEGFAANPQGRLADLPLLTEAERRRALVEWNRTQRMEDGGWRMEDRDPPSSILHPPSCADALFEAQVEHTPDTIALVFEDQQITYDALNRRANQLAHHLRGLGAGPETLVGLCIEPSPELVVGVLGILKAGGAYVPLEPTYPAERLAFMLADSRPMVLLTATTDDRQPTTDNSGVETPHPLTRSPAHPLTAVDGGPWSVVALLTDWPTIAREPDTNPESAATLDNLAYVIYTSGSTGRPKGTLLAHRGLYNFTQVAIATFAITPDSRVLQFAAFSFDASVSEIVMALLAGAALVLAPRETLASAPALLDLLRRQAITTVTLPPSLLAVLAPEDLPLLRTVVSAGEACPWEIAERWSAGRRFLNGYGPTEATVAASYYRFTGRVAGARNVPVGGPIANARLYVLDRSGQPAPIGVPGELYIGGVQLARGYLGRPDLTAERFIPNPFGRLEIRDWRLSDADSSISNLQSLISSGTRLYKTGDLARYLPDGTIVFLGRVDQQVKVRGYRIELGEIEAALARHPVVQAAVVLAREDVPGDARLVAYITTTTDNRPPTTEVEDRGWKIEDGISDGSGQPSSILYSPSSIQGELRAFLKQYLPEYMLPSAFMLIDRLPLTPNGKIDRGALPAPAGVRPTFASNYVAPRTPTEEILAGIWAQVLGVAQVGAFDSFFELGGHSLLATQLLSRLRDVFQVELPLRSLFEAPTPAGLALAVERARLEGRGLPAPPIVPVSREAELPLSFAQQRLWFLDQLEPGSPLYSIPTAIRLSGALNIAVLRRCLGELVARHEILRTAIATIDGRPQQMIAPISGLEHTEAQHGADSKDNHRRGILNALAMPIVDLRGLEDQEHVAQQLAAEEARQPFDLARGPLLRVTLLRMAPREHIALFTMHHIISDGWSMGVFIREIAALYAAFGAGQPAPLPELPLQYADYAAWQRGWLQGAALEQQIAYWKEQLAGSPPLLELPTDRPRPAVQRFVGTYQTFLLNPDLSGQLTALSRQAGATLFMTLLAAFQTLLYRYSGQDDISIGTPIAGRNRAEIEDLIGFFVNTLVLRADLSGEPGFRALLARVRAICLNAYAHQDLPFEMIVDALQPERNLSHTPLFQVMFALQNAPVRAQELADLTISPEEAHSGTAKFDLTLEMSETTEGIGGSLEYNTDLFDEATIARLIGHFEHLLAGIAQEPERSIATLPLLSETERAQLLAERRLEIRDWRLSDSELRGNRPSAPIPQPLPPRRREGEQTSPSLPAWERGPGSEGERAPYTPHHLQSLIHTQFEEQAARTPDVIALVCESERLSYATLNARANQLAHHLQHLGAGPDSLVALYLDRSLDMLIAILGVLKAGAAYLPIDPAYPQERIAFMLADSQARLVISQEIRDWRLEIVETQDIVSLQSLISNLQSPTIISLDADWPTIAQEPTSNPEHSAHPDNLAYVIYTSGSTGTPKGSPVTHANVMRLFSATDEWFHFNERDVWTMFHSVAFDFSVWEIWGALLYGGRLIVIPYLLSRDPAGFYSLLAEEQVTVLNQTPAAFRQLMAVEAAQGVAPDLALRYVVFGGEALELPSLRPWFERHGDERPQLINMYGITETTVHVTYRPLSIADLDAPVGSAIGVAIPDLAVYVLDRHLQPVPLGVPGELYVGGAGLARGYLGRPALTAERFIPNPFERLEIRDWRLPESEPPISNLQSLISQGTRLYKTGDRARWRASGELEYLGRLDHQVKLRGFRIELGEIAAALARYPQVREALVIVREDVPGQQRLVAYLTPTTDHRPPTTGPNDKVTRRQGDKVIEAGESVTRSPVYPFTASGESVVSGLSSVVGELRTFLATSLPEYMIPSAFVVLDQLPLTGNGKVDRRALPLPEATRPEQNAGYKAPRTQEEEILAQIWAQVLGLAQVGVDENFFALGGDSILSIQVIARARAAGLHLTARQFFLHPTIAGQAALAEKDGAVAAEQGLVTGPAPLTPIQHWFFEQHPLEPHHWNTSILLEVAPDLDSDLLERAVQHLLAHHDALRLRFTRTAAGWEQHGAPVDRPAPFRRVDLTALPTHKHRQAIEAEAAALQTSLDLAEGPLVRVAHFSLGARHPGRLLIIFHHLVIDGVSLRIVLADLMTVYQQLRAGTPAELPPKTTAFQTWARRLADYAQEPALREELDYWTRIARYPAPALPVDYPGGANTYGSTERVFVSLGARETRALLQEVPAAYGTQINDILLTALALACAGWTGERRLLVELDTHGRMDFLEDVDLSRTVGWCTCVFPLLLDLGSAPDPDAAIGAVRGRLNDLPRRGIGYGLLRYLCEDAEVQAQMRALPQPEVSFNYLGQFDQRPDGVTEASPFRVAPESPGPEHHPHGRRGALLYVVGNVAGGELDLMWSYSANVHQRTTIERLAESYIKELRRLIAHCLAGAPAI